MAYLTVILYIWYVLLKLTNYIYITLFLKEQNIIYKNYKI